MRERFINGLLACAAVAGITYGMLGHNSPWAVLVMLRRPKAFLLTLRLVWRVAWDDRLVERLKATGDVDSIAQEAFEKPGLGKKAAP